MKHLAIILSASLFLYGCSLGSGSGKAANMNPTKTTTKTVSKDYVAPPTPKKTVASQPKETACSGYNGLIGKKYQDIPANKLPPYYSTRRSGQSPSNHQPNRVNLYLDAVGNISKVTCG